MPTHEIEGEDYTIPGSGALAGERIYKDADPATAFREYEANAIYHGLRALVKQEQISGDLTAASGAADQTEGYIKLAKAIRRAANRPVFSSLVMDGDGMTWPVVQDAFAFLISEDGGGPYPSGALYPDTSNPTRDVRRVIIVINGSSTPKCVGDSAAQDMATLAPGEACAFVGTLDTGVTKWVPIGKELDQSAFGLRNENSRLYNNANPAETSSSFTCEFIRHANGRIVTLNTEYVQIILTTGGGSAITMAPQGGGEFTNSLQINADFDAATLKAPRFLILGSDNGVEAVMVANWDNGTIQIRKVGGGTFTAGHTIVIYPWTQTYFVMP